MDLISWKESLTPPKVLLDSLIILVCTVAWLKYVASFMLLVGQHTCQANSTQLFWLGMTGILVHKKYDYQSLSFISSVALLPAGLHSTLTESCRNIIIIPLLVSLVNTQTKLLPSPLCTGNLSLLSTYSLFKFFHIFIFSFFIFWRTMHRNLFISEVEEGSQLIERKRGRSSKEVFCIYLWHHC